MIVPQEDLRHFLSQPLGILFMKDSLWKTRIPLDFNTITVGDYVTSSYIKFFNRAPPLAFVDFKTKRTDFKEFDIPTYFDNVFEIKNPRGTILIQTIIDVLLEAIIGFPEDKTLMIVDGEEDLIPLILFYVTLPENTIVVYGQPDVGVVVYRFEQIRMIMTSGINTVAKQFFHHHFNISEFNSLFIY